MNDTIKVLCKEPYTIPREVIIPNELEMFQKLVDGPIQVSVLCSILPKPPTSTPLRRSSAIWIRRRLLSRRGRLSPPASTPATSTRTASASPPNSAAKRQTPKRSPRSTARRTSRRFRASL